ncbi:zincin-like metallopeptidase domain-containing protein [Methylosinus sp. LW3]|uniref:ArdC family protein n=1 Tax=Methylosinus sp. LW3 TaxID=107635 RepID=UPI000463E978|nr:zincin-like metallopeptidase domain-containing protein [Methylosinus sp. LW3]
MNNFKKHKAHAPTRRDHYREVTDRIVAALEAGTPPWRRPWDPRKSGAPLSPINAVTGRRYHGINVLLLGMSQFSFANGDPRFCSYKQAKDRGWQVRAGEKGTTIYFYKQLQVEDRDAPSDGEEHTRNIPLLRSFTVFNGSQIDGIPAFTPPTIEEAPWRRFDAADIIMRNSGAVIRIGGDRAFYRPATDTIHLPPKNAFRSPEGLASVEIHELAHWSGARSRLNRDLSGEFGSAKYAFEELSADLASCFVNTELGLPTEIENHASYVSFWLERLKSDKREIFRAAAAAQKAADFCLAFHPDFAESHSDSDEQDAADSDAPLVEAA